MDKCTFTVATSENWKTADGEWKSVSDFHSIEIKGEKVKWLPKTLSKGDFVILTGRAVARNYVRADGQKDIWRCIDVERIEVGLFKADSMLLKSIRGEDGSYAPQVQYQQPVTPNLPQPPVPYQQSQSFTPKPIPQQYPDMPQQPQQPQHTQPAVNQYGQPIVGGTNYDFSPE